MYDIVIKNGTIFDSHSRSFYPGDIAVSDGKIAKIGVVEDDGAHTVDASGLYIVPGLIDMHCHIHPFFPLAEDSLPTIHPDAHMPACGVTTAVDAGTCGLIDFPAFKKTIIDQSSIRIFGFLNIADRGMVHLDSEQEPDELRPYEVGEYAKFEDCIVGIKTAHYWVDKPFDSVHTPWLSIDAAMEAGIIANKPIMVDFRPTLPERSYEKMLSKMRKGDIHTHIYAKHFNLLDSRKKVNDFAKKARDKGVIFDLGHGEGSFVFENAYPAYQDSFYPDTISTDLYLDNVNGPAFNLLYTMSKYMAIGMPLEEVLYRTTARPAEVIGHNELGFLAEDSPADIVLLSCREGQFAFPDSDGKRINGSQKLECHMTIAKGVILYNPNAMGLPHWSAS